ncbi:serine protease [Herbidospora sp. NEAU-GS84]|uniref:Serine protease n=1 Tax=Herbidospora solisilvae TaxID=2696284 RepID=A0A7C9JHC7_9ACTN|nr:MULTISPECIES: serine protease [Herbidospora]NAS27444.1 serine protease [Herbidospora solisilvae]GLX97465.1 peptidase [Herbidospora sp. NBRC 101105]
MISRARRLSIPVAGALVAFGVVGTASSATATAPSDVTQKAAPTTAAAAAQFWTPDRLRAAKDRTEELGNAVKGSGRPSTPQPDGKAGVVPPIGGEKAGTPASKQVNLPNTVGRVFFTLPGKNPLDPKSWKYCSGTSIQGKFRNVVATAGHCVYDPASNRFYDNWVFIPSYWDGTQAWNGKAPYGIYPATWYQAHDDFVVKEDYDYDYAFVNVASGYKASWEKVDGKYKLVKTSVGRLGDNVGGQGFTWNRSTKTNVFSFGYPAGPHPDGDRPFSGKTMKWCYGQTAAMPAAPKYNVQEHVGIKCGMTAGASGGPLIWNYKSKTRSGYLYGVNSIAWDTDGNDRYDRLSSPYFNGETYDVYKVAANRWTA